MVHRDGPLICSVVPLKPCILQKRGERETSSKHDRQDGGEIRLRCAAAVALLCPREGSGINVETIRWCQKVGIFTCTTGAISADYLSKENKYDKCVKIKDFNVKK